MSNQLVRVGIQTN